jgi:hypothetical protein
MTQTLGEWVAGEIFGIQKAERKIGRKREQCHGLMVAVCGYSAVNGHV